MHQPCDRFLVTLRGFQLVVLCGTLATLPGCGARTSLGFDETATGGKSATENPALAAGGSAAFGAAATGGASSHAGASNEAGAGGSAPPPCEAVTVALDALRPAVTLLVDQSRSMAAHFPTQSSPETRWSVMGKALFDPTNGVVKTYQGSVRFGIAFFTAHNGFTGGICPILNEVPAATNNYAALSALYQSLAPDGSTPTGESINQVVSEIKTKGEASQHSIVLVTDGDPNTCANPFPGAGEGQPVAVAAAQSAYAAGIDLYVLGISGDIAGSNLQQLANAGKGKNINQVWGVDPDAEQPYLASESALGLTTQFADILAKIPFCEVRLQRDVSESELRGARVVLDGEPIPLSPSNGYALKDPRHLEMIGSACTAIKSGARRLSVRISCD